MFLRDYCTFHPLSNRIIKSLQDFDCGHADLNDFFANDCYPYELELIGKTYCFTLDTNPAEVVCAFTIANDSIKVHDIPNSRKKKLLKGIPREKRMRSEQQEKEYMGLSKDDDLKTRLLYFDLILLKA